MEGGRTSSAAFRMHCCWFVESTLSGTSTDGDEAAPVLGINLRGLTTKKLDERTKFSRRAPKLTLVCHFGRFLMGRGSHNFRAVLHLFW